jgi:hypothetical protein
MAYRRLLSAVALLPLLLAASPDPTSIPPTTSPTTKPRALTEAELLHIEVVRLRAENKRLAAENKRLAVGLMANAPDPADLSFSADTPTDPQLLRAEQIKRLIRGRTYEKTKVDPTNGGISLWVRPPFRALDHDAATVMASTVYLFYKGYNPSLPGIVICNQFGQAIGKYTPQGGLVYF